MRSSRFSWLPGWSLAGAFALTAAGLFAAPKASAAEAPGDGSGADVVEKGGGEAGAATAKEAEALRLIQEGEAPAPGIRKTQKVRGEKGVRRAERVRGAEGDEGIEDEPRPGRRVPVPVPWGWYPWYGVPQTAYVIPGSIDLRDQYWNIPPVTHVPRLGLQYNYPWAYQMGIRIPDDSSPLDHPPTMGPFVGVVQQAKDELARLTEEEPEDTVEAVSLMKEGKYTEAGKILAAAFQDSDDPRYPLLLTEVFVGLEKPAHAEALLRHALSLRGVAEALPDDVAGHFPSAEEFQKRADAIVAKGDHPLLAAYLLVQSKEPSRGVDLLQKMKEQVPGDEAASLLYRHYLGKVFQAK